MQKSTMPNFIECLANIAENNSKFLSVIQSLFDIISKTKVLLAQAYVTMADFWLP
jgi:hypothetical protein